MKHEASLPRRMYWSTDVGGCSLCPECRGVLDRAFQAYVLAVRQGGEVSPFVVGNDGGYFCRKCPVVVLDHAEFSEYAHASTRNTKGGKFVVLGLVDLDAVPMEKRNRSFTEPDNPIPLVKFTNIGEEGSVQVAAPRRPVSGNEYCPCGSNKKFKKCCALKVNGADDTGGKPVR